MSRSISSECRDFEPAFSAMLREPRRQPDLGVAVGGRGVDVVDAGRQGGVEDARGLVGIHRPQGGGAEDHAAAVVAAGVSIPFAASLVQASSPPSPGQVVTDSGNPTAGVVPDLPCGTGSRPARFVPGTSSHAGRTGLFWLWLAFGPAVLSARG